MSQETKDIVVFMIRRETECAECKRELWRGNFIRLENQKALCLECADLDHLEYLPAGNTALTRRATKYSKLHAKVVQWSRTRKRYERQGILAQPSAIQQAEEECLADAELREARRQRQALKRDELDQRYIEEFSQQIRNLFPKCPSGAETQIAEHACRKHSGRVGRSQAAKQFEPQAITLAVQAHIRHNYTPYDELMITGYDRFDARNLVSNQVEEILNRWRESK